MELCSRCHKRMPVVFVSKFENGKMVNEGLCIKCALELGIKQVEAAIQQMGLSDEDIERMSAEVDPEELQAEIDSLTAQNEENGKAPAMDFSKLFGNMMGASAPSGSETEEPQKNGIGKKQKQDKSRKFLDAYCMNLTAKAAEGKLDAVIGRDRELTRVLQILCRRQKNNPCLIGEPGVGKTAIAEALAQRIVEHKVPYKLADKEVYLMDLTALVAGTQFRGQFETRMKGLIEEVKKLGNILLVIDEVHTIASAGDAEGSMNAANILKPALSRGELQVIGATTLTEYRKYIEKDAALERRFQPIVVEEPSVEDTCTMLTGIKKYYEDFHKIRIPDAVVRNAVVLSERYITDRFLPDKAIDLLDEAAAHVELENPCIGAAEQTKKELEAAIAEREKLESESENTTDEAALPEKYQKIADLRTKEINLQTELDRQNAEKAKLELTTNDIAQVIEVWTGIPASRITENEFHRIDRLEATLKSRIIGQDQAVEAVSRAIKRNRAGVTSKRKPVSFIFAGPTGVGKTELVKQLSAELFDSPDALIRLDMSEYMEKHAVSRMIGSPPGYVGYDDAGQLTEKVRRKPYSVILLDEIEKAHPDVMNILLQILDDGRITDAHGKTVNFENTVIVMTTNVGSGTGTMAPGFGGSEELRNEGKTEKALSEFLRPEFLNRVDEVITFRSLDESDFEKIAVLMLNELKSTLAEREIRFAFTEAASKQIAKNSFSRKYGARNMRRYIQREVEDQIANRLIGSYDKDIGLISLDAEDGKLVIACI